jgi:hypothetical protein
VRRRAKESERAKGAFFVIGGLLSSLPVSISSPRGADVSTIGQVLVKKLSRAGGGRPRAGRAIWQDPPIVLY